RRQRLLPAFGELAVQSPLQLLALLGEFVLVFLKELVPLLLGGSTLGSGLRICIVNFLRNIELLLRAEAELLLDLLGIIGLQRVTVDTSGTLELGAVTNCSSELNHGRLVRDLFAGCNGLLHSLQISVTLLDADNMP